MVVGIRGRTEEVGDESEFGGIRGNDGWRAERGCFQSTRSGEVCQTCVTDFAWSGLKFFVRCRSRILRDGDGEEPHKVRLF